MTYTIVIGDRREIRRLVGPRPFSEILTHEELIQVERGELVGEDEYDHLLDLSSPLKNGAVIKLRLPNPAKDLASFGVPVNSCGELVGIKEALEVRTYEQKYELDLWHTPLSKIREKMKTLKEQESVAVVALQNENSELRAENRRLREELQALKKSKVREVPTLPKCERCQTELDPYTGRCMCSR